MPYKSQIPWLLAAVVLTAYTHCVFSHAMEAADRHHQLRSEEHPLDNTRATCENESSCICKGATLAVVTEVSAPELTVVHTFCADPSATFLGSVAESFGRRILPDDGNSPNSGGILRAQLQCFLL